MFHARVCICYIRAFYNTDFADLTLTVISIQVDRCFPIAEPIVEIYPYCSGLIRPEDSYPPLFQPFKRLLMRMSVNVVAPALYHCDRR